MQELRHDRRMSRYIIQKGLDFVFRKRRKRQRDMVGRAPRPLHLRSQRPPPSRRMEMTAPPRAYTRPRGRRFAWSASSSAFSHSLPHQVLPYCSFIVFSSLLYVFLYYMKSSRDRQSVVTDSAPSRGRLCALDSGTLSNGVLETISPDFFIPLPPSNLRPFGAPPSIGRRECPREPLPLEGAAERSEAGLASFWGGEAATKALNPEPNESKVKRGCEEMNLHSPVFYSMH